MQGPVVPKPASEVAVWVVWVVLQGRRPALAVEFLHICRAAGSIR